MSTGHPDAPRLVADIGGTNARFALVRAAGERPCEIGVLACADYPDLAAAVESYLSRLDSPRPTAAAVAVATPITGDRVKLTNHVWTFSIEETRARLRFDALHMINDFTALAMSLPYLEPEDLHQVGGGAPVPNTPMALIGPGTGLGVSGLIPVGDDWIPLDSEGGHVTYGAANRGQTEILSVIGQRFNHVSAERLVSGPGLLNLYRAMAELQGVDAPLQTPAEVSGQALHGGSALCLKALEMFCAILGTAAGNLVLTLGARGGVFIGGGIVPRLGEFFDTSPFRQSFEHRGRFSDYLAAVPSYVIRAEFPALIGAARIFSAGPGARSGGAAARTT